MRQVVVLDRAERQSGERRVSVRTRLQLTVLAETECVLELASEILRLLVIDLLQRDHISIERCDHPRDSFGPHSPIHTAALVYVVGSDAQAIPGVVAASRTTRA